MALEHKKALDFGADIIRKLLERLVIAVDLRQGKCALAFILSMYYYFFLEKILNLLGVFFKETKPIVGITARSARGSLLIVFK